MAKRNSSSTSSKRKVSFDRRVQVVEIRHHRQYSAEEVKNCWHSIEEFTSIRDEARRTIAQYNELKRDIDSISSSSISSTIESMVCLRGLEHHARSERNSKVNLRKEAWYAVLDEQDLQYDLGSTNNWAILSDVYRIFSAPAAKIAHQTALNDEMEARHVLHEAQSPRRSFRRKVSSNTKESKCTYCAGANQFDHYSPSLGSVERKRLRRNSIVSQAA